MVVVQLWQTIINVVMDFADNVLYIFQPLDLFGYSISPIYIVSVGFIMVLIPLAVFKWVNPLS